MRVTQSLSCLAAWAVVGACAAFTHTLPPRSTSDTPVHASFDKTWSALMDWTTANGLLIKSTDRASGLLVSEFSNVTFSSANGKRIADCGTTFWGMFKKNPKAASSNILVRGDSTTSNVRVVLAYADSDGRPCISSGALEEAWESAIRDKAEKP